MSKTKRKPEAEPWVENYPVLKTWLDQHHGHCLWQVPLGDKKHPRAYVECWVVSANEARGEVIVRVLADQHGWNLFTSNRSLDVAPTFADAEARLQPAVMTEPTSVSKTFNDLLSDLMQIVDDDIHQNTGGVSAALIDVKDEYRRVARLAREGWERVAQFAHHYSAPVSAVVADEALKKLPKE